MFDLAALAGAFLPERYLRDAEDDAALGELSSQCSEEIRDGKVFWRIATSARARALADLAGRPDDLKRRWREHPPLRDDDFGKMLKTIATGAKLAAIHRMSDARLAAAIDAAASAKDLVPDRTEPIKVLERALNSETMKRTAARRKAAILPHRLFGRTAERDTINAFLATGNVGLPAKMLGPTTPRVPAMLLTGSPGMGKSAFLADFLARRTAAEGWIIQFDFDQTTLTQGGRIAWSEELTRQFALQAEVIAPKLSQKRGELAAARVRAPSPSAYGSHPAILLQTLADALTAFPRRPLLLVFDTIEEVTALDATDSFETTPLQTAFADLLAWVGELAAISVTGAAPCFDGVRVLAAGRAAPPVASPVLARWFTAEMELPDLDAPAATGLLQRLFGKVRFGLHRSQRIIDAVGGHPLHLILVQKHLAGASLADIDAFIDELAENSLRGAKADFITQALYSRFLQRFQVHNLDPRLQLAQIQRLAHPGLLLRTVDAELLQHVIAPACDVVLPDQQAAQSALAALRDQAWLVTRDSTDRNVIRHKPDVRRVMLPMMLNKESKDFAQAQTVLRAGVAWFKGPGQSRTGALAEAGYLQALLGETAPFVADAGLASSVLALAGEDLRVMSLPVRATLRVQTNRNAALSELELAALPEELRFQSSMTQVRTKLTKQAFRSVAPDFPASGIELVSVHSQGDLALATAEPPQAAPPRPAAKAPDAAWPWAADLSWIASRENAYDMFTDQSIGSAVEISFRQGEFDEAARIGWTAMQRIGSWPSLDGRMTLRGDLTSHWLWLTALASQVAPPEPDIVDDVARRIFGHGQQWPWGGHLDETCAFSTMDAIISIIPGSHEVLQSAVRYLSLELRDRVDIVDFDTLRIVGFARDFAPALRNGQIAVDLQLPIPSHHPLIQVLIGEGEPRERRILNVSQHSAVLPVILRGQTPEVHVTLLPALAAVPRNLLASAIEHSRARTSIWPDHLTGAAFLAEQHGTANPLTRLDSLVQHVDACGLLTDFVTDLSQEAGSNVLNGIAVILRNLDGKSWKAPVTTAH
jgi:AAA ATPase domain